MKPDRRIIADCPRCRADGVVVIEVKTDTESGAIEDAALTGCCDDWRCEREAERLLDDAEWLEEKLEGAGYLSCSLCPATGYFPDHPLCASCRGAAEGGARSLYAVDRGVRRELDRLVS